MHRRTLLAAGAGLAWKGTAWARPTASPIAPGDTVAWPDGVTLLDGSAWAPKPGHAQVIVRWATWCGYCRRHNEHVNTLVQGLGDVPLQVLGVATDRDPAAVRRHVAAHGYRFPVTLDDAAFSAMSAGRRVIPLTITVDRQGRLREIIPGEMAEADVLALATLAR
jgi:thiol-disulfide isomerase/thioredoxin